MARLATLRKGDWDRFDRHLNSCGLTAEEVVKINKNPAVLSDMLAAMRQHSDFRLIHGMFHPLKDKLEMVRDWPGVTGDKVDAAFVEARDRIRRFDEESPHNNGLNIVVSVYHGTAHETLAYARDRMVDTFGNDFWQWDDAYASGIDENRVRYLQDSNGNTIVPVYRDCVRIEVIDLFANWNQRRGMEPHYVRNASSAHAAVFYSAAQDPDWVWTMDGKKVPYALAGGFEVNVNVPDDSEPWSYVPRVARNERVACLCARGDAYRFHDTSLPSLWE